MSFGGSGGSSSIGGSTDVALSNPQTNDVLTYDGGIAKWKNAEEGGSSGGGSSAGSFLFSSQTASIATSAAIAVSTAVTIGQCRLSCTGAPAGSNLTVALQASPDGGTTWNSVQSLSVVAGTTTAVTATPNYAVTANSLLRVNCTSAGSSTAATGVLYQADYS